MNKELKEALQEAQAKDILSLKAILAQSKIPNFRLLVLLLLTVSDKDYKIISSKLTEAENEVLAALEENNVSKLNELGVSPDVINALLIKAISLEKWDIATELLSKPTINLNYQDMDGNTALHIAVMCNNIIMVQLLINHEIDVSIRNSRGKTAHDLAVHNMRNSSESKVLAILDSGQNTAEKGHTAAIQRAARVYDTPLHYAASSGNVKELKRLLECGADANIINIFTGHTALSYAALNDKLEAVIVLLANNAKIAGVASGNPEIIALLKAAKDPNKLLLTGVTEGDLTKVTIALGRGADFKLIDPNTGKTTLELALELKSSHPEVAALLEHTNDCVINVTNLFKHIINKGAVDAPAVRHRVRNFLKDFPKDLREEWKLEARSCSANLALGAKDLVQNYFEVIPEDQRKALEASLHRDIIAITKVLTEALQMPSVKGKLDKEINAASIRFSSRLVINLGGDKAVAAAEDIARKVDNGKENPSGKAAAAVTRRRSPSPSSGPTGQGR
jgi:ankyrin repeat protein